MRGFLWFLRNFEEVSGAAILMGMAALAFLNVVTRYFIKYSFAFTEELEVSAMVWLTMLGAASAFKRGTHLRLLFFLERLPAGTRRAVEVGLMVLSLCLFLAIGILSLFQIQEEVVLEITTEALEIPQWIYTLGIPFGCLLIMVRLLGQLRQRLRGV